MYEAIVDVALLVAMRAQASKPFLVHEGLQPGSNSEEPSRHAETKVYYNVVENITARAPAFGGHGSRWAGAAPTS